MAKIAMYSDILNFFDLKDISVENKQYILLSHNDDRIITDEKAFFS